MALNLSALTNIKTKSGTQIDKVVTKSGKVLWTRSTPYYAIQGGKLKNCPNASAWYGGYLAAQKGECSYSGYNFYGGNSHVGGGDDITHSWGADTGNMDTKGCAKLRVKPHVYTSDYPGDRNATLTIYGNGSVVATYTIAWNANSNTEKTIDISAYTTARVHINVVVYEESGGYPSCGLVDVQFHD